MSKVIATEVLNVDSGVVSLTPSIYNPPTGPCATFAMIHAEGGAMRYCDCGQNPTQSFGALLEDGDIVELPSIYHLKNFRVVKADAEAGKITVTYED
ncbi:MAG TPA: hypothetical protein PLV52_00440 [Candidatus Omnitrophota bacterium]|nr:hypothetical protein [Candidatus Omnitrophota bacterium]